MICHLAKHSFPAEMSLSSPIPILRSLQCSTWCKECKTFGKKTSLLGDVNSGFGCVFFSFCDLLPLPSFWYKEATLKTFGQKQKDDTDKVSNGLRGENWLQFAHFLNILVSAQNPVSSIHDRVVQGQNHCILRKVSTQRSVRCGKAILFTTSAGRYKQDIGFSFRWGLTD